MNTHILRRGSLVLGLAVLLIAASAASASASSGFKAEYFPTKVSGKINSLSINGVAMCGKGSVEATLRQAAGVLIAENDTCSESFNGFKLNNCLFRFAPGKEIAAGQFAGSVGFGPGGCSMSWPSGCHANGPQHGIAATYINTKESASTVQVNISGTMLASCGAKEEGASISGGFTLEGKNLAAEPDAFAASNELTLPRFCAVSGGSCTGENQYLGDTPLLAGSSQAVITAKFKVGTGKVVCNQSSAEVLLTQVSQWTLSDCHLGSSTGTACEPVITEGTPASSTLAQGSGNNGILSVGPVSWNIECYGGTVLVCTYSFEPQLDIEAGSPAKLIASEEPMSQSGPGCLGNTPKFTSTYTINSPNPLYVATG